MKTVCQENRCTGCFACVDSCPKAAISIVDSVKAVNAVIDEKACISCGLCEKVCQKHGLPEMKEPIAWQQGWAADAAVRSKSSSGGAAAAISRAFVENGGVVCSCVFREGEFCFDFAENVAETERFIGSKYVKSNPAGIYKQIRSRLKQGQKVLFIGLPCQVGALKKLVGEPENLYTADLVCHGTPSKKLLEQYLQQQERPLGKTENIVFRMKNKKQLILDGTGIAPIGVSDRYSIAFLEGLTFTDNCYACDYAGLKRVSDVTLGDSYGSTLAQEEQRKGISLLLCQTPKGQQLLEQAQLVLHPVDLDIAVRKNGQLKCPVREPSERSAFWRGFRAGKSIQMLVLAAAPVQCLRQAVKSRLLRLQSR